MKKYIFSVLALLGVTVICLGLHYFILQSLGKMAMWASVDYSLWGMYGFQVVVSLVGIIILGLMAEVMPKWLGFIFLGTMTLKLVFNYIYIAKGLEVPAADFIKFNYFAAFVIYFVFDVFVAYRAINQWGEVEVDKK